MIIINVEKICPKFQSVTVSKCENNIIEIKVNNFVVFYFIFKFGAFFKRVSLVLHVIAKSINEGHFVCS